jgi:predicted lipid-binding transport protein (Tim44 family)
MLVQGAVELSDPLVVVLIAIWAISVLVSWFPRSDARRLELLAKETKAWLEIAARVTDTKAAVYAVIGVFFGAAGGLMADFVTTGKMSGGEAFRGVCVLVGFTVITVIAVRVVVRLTPEKKSAAKKDAAAQSSPPVPTR